jgi:hypothetical protein
MAPSMNSRARAAVHRRVIAMILGALVLSIVALAVPPLTGGSFDEATFAVTVRGRPGQPVHLRAVHIPRGYLASFCTARICAPVRVSFDLPRSGRESIELRLIQEALGAPRPGAVTVAADGARSATLPLLSFGPAAQPRAHRNVRTAL